MTLLLLPTVALWALTVVTRWRKRGFKHFVSVRDWSESSHAWPPPFAPPFSRTLCWSCVQLFGSREETRAILDVHDILLCMCVWLKGMLVLWVYRVLNIRIFNITLLQQKSLHNVWGTYTNCNSSAVPQWLWMYTVLFQERWEKI